MISKLLLMIFLSISVRNSNIENTPADYELAGGLEVPHFEATTLYERESGQEYTGYRLNGDYSYFYGDIHYKEAKGINSQSFGGQYPLSDWFKLRLGGNWNSWKSGTVMAGYDITTKYLQLGYSTNFNHRSIFTSRLGTEYYLSKQISLVPYFTYNSHIDTGRTKEDWNAKCELRFKL